MKTFHVMAGFLAAMLAVCGCNSGASAAAASPADATAADAKAADAAKVCADDKQCADGEFCSKGACAADLCNPATAATCDGDAAKSCQPNGGGWVTAPCKAGEKCTGGVCAAPKVTCPPKEITDDFAKIDALSQAYKTCSNSEGCMAKGDDAARAACFAACVSKSFSLTAACGTCLGQYAVCLFSTCKAQCAVDPSAKPCEGCAQTNCDPALAKCPL